jgi:hypothetical protein
MNLSNLIGFFLFEIIDLIKAIIKAFRERNKNGKTS